MSDTIQERLRSHIYHAVLDGSNNTDDALFVLKCAAHIDRLEARIATLEVDERRMIAAMAMANVYVVWKASEAIDLAHDIQSRLDAEVKPAP